MIGFTLCSNNYLALARSLSASWARHHPGDGFVVGLVDKRDPTIDYFPSGGAEVVEVADIGIPDFDELVRKYDITELNTAVKPYFFEFLFKTRSDDKIIYLDPDILIFQPFSRAKNLLDRYDFVLTPQICSPIDEGKGPTDYHLLRCGVYNLGFLALRRGDNVPGFLSWWQERMKRFAYRRDTEGLFYDQIWMNYISTFYDNFFVLRDLGYNVANWNLHERVVSFWEGKFLINGSVNLVFFHFSHYKLEHPEIIAAYNKRYTFESRPDIVPLYDLYRSTVLSHGHEALRSKPCYYMRSPEPVESNWAPRKMARMVVKTIVGLPPIRRTISKLSQLL